LLKSPEVAFWLLPESGISTISWEVTDIRTGSRTLSDRVYRSQARDRVGIHDLTFPGYSSFAYETLLKVGKKKGCIENLTDALNQELNNRFETFEIPPPFTLFMNVEYDLKSNQPKILPAASKAGDYVKLRSDMDCLVAVSSSPDDITDCNRGRVKPLEVRIDSI
jgi:uncharacterized protein